MNYQEYLKSYKWNALKQKVLRRDNYLCQGCLSETKNLQVHHLTYDRVQNEMCFDLITLCRKCHSFIHNKDSVEDFILEYPLRKNETMYKKHNSIFVGYKDEYSNEIKKFMELMSKLNIDSYFAIQNQETFYLSSIAFDKFIIKNRSCFFYTKEDIENWKDHRIEIMELSL